MKHILGFWGLTATALLSVGAIISSCQRVDTATEAINPIEVRDGSFNIVGNLSDYKLRAHDGVWEAGDRIGIYAFNPGTVNPFGSFSNVQYATVTDGGVFTATDGGVLLKEGEKADIIAYYPYVATLNGNTYSVDIANQKPLKNIDLLWGKGTVTADAETTTVPVNFEHQLSLLQLRFVAKEGKSLPKSIDAKLSGVTTDASFDLTTGVLSKGQSAKDLTFKSENNAINAILIPGDELSQITFTFDGVEVLYKIPTPFQLKADTRYVLTLSPYADNGIMQVEIVANGTEGSISDWNEEVTFSDDIPYASKTPEEGEGEDDPSTDEPDQPVTTSNLLFPGSDFETDPNVGDFGYKDAEIASGVGVDGSKALHISGTPSGNNYIFSTPTFSGEAGKSYTKITFKLKGTSAGKSLSINLYDANGKYWGFNVGDVSGDKMVTNSGTTASTQFVNDYNGTIDTKGEWVTITLDIAGLAFNTSGNGNVIAFKDGKSAAYDLYLDQITIE